MTTLREALADAVETDAAVHLDHAGLQHRGIANRRLVRFGQLGAGVAAVAFVVAGVMVADGLRPPPDIDVAAPPSADSSADESPQPTVETGPSGETYEQWRERKRGYVDDAVAQAGPQQADALADGRVTEREFVASAHAYEQCMRDAGYDVTILRDTTTSGADGFSLNMDGTTAAQFDRVDAGCYDTFHGAIDALWQEQHADHRKAWDEWLEHADETGSNDGAPEEMATAIIPIESSA